MTKYLVVKVDQSSVSSIRGFLIDSHPESSHIVVDSDRPFVDMSGFAHFGIYEDVNRHFNFVVGESIRIKNQKLENEVEFIKENPGVKTHIRFKSHYTGQEATYTGTVRFNRSLDATDFLYLEDLDDYLLISNIKSITRKAEKKFTSD